jgi:quercetin dioxygenase-like cupin family protein
MGSKGYSSSMMILWVMFVAFLIMCMEVKAADPDPVVDFPAGPSAPFTLHNVFVNGVVSQSSGGTRAALSTEVFPASIGEGITAVRFVLVPCGVNVPHTHPRATELLNVVSGGPLLVGWVDTSGVYHSDQLFAGDVVLFPRGLLHFEQNLGNTNCTFISALNSQNPGVLNAGQALFALPNTVLATAFNIPTPIIQLLKNDFSPALLQTNGLSGCRPLV